MKKTVPFQIRFPEEILEQLKAVADNQYTTSSEIIRRLVIDYLKSSQTNSMSSNTGNKAKKENVSKIKEEDLPF